MLPFIKKRYKENLLLLLIIVCSVCLKLKSAFITAEAFNCLVVGKTDLFIEKVCLLGTLYFIYTIFFSFKSWYQVYVRQKLLVDLRKRLVDYYSKYSYKDKQALSGGKMISWLTTDIERIDNEGYQNLYSILEAIIDISFSLIALFTINLRLMLAIIVLALINLVLPKIVDRKLAKAFEKLTKQQEIFASNISNFFLGFSTLFSLNKQSYFIARLSQESEIICDTQIDTYKTVGIATFFAVIGNVLGQIGSLVISGLFVAQKLLTFGHVFSVSTISVSIFNGVSNLSGSIIELKGILPIFQKYEHLYQEVDKKWSLENQKISDFYFNSEMVLDNISLSFGEHRVFNQLNVTFQKGKKYCITGPSGSGKSTLFHLLNGSQDYDSGQIWIDGIPLQSLAENTLRSQVTYIEQEAFIFNATLLENIVLDGQYSTKEINEVISKVGLSKELEQFEKRGEILIGGEGIQLSGGQKQRIALARAILNGSQFLLLDESTSSVNKELAHYIEQNLLSDNTLTIVMITHHLNKEIEADFDHILELKNGQLTEKERF
ncbi:ABC transporter ATP-binding protein [Streptococcus penaeicida]|uniref:ABC transporter ATP-binding protein n=1 Tax=Streptococcus penaeicida TaxID=1765960 RepID=A0A2N8LEJ1_9STRE|nr:ABC transporter ATP-binding protein [Streptococcus penaeicida]PND48582.1 ABC transporter ATP-binding protein [Streptococcus penaeicida]